MVDNSKESCGIAKCKLVLARHGESQFADQGIFGGWYDSPLSVRGVKECVMAGNVLNDLEYRFDEAHTSVLQRAAGGCEQILRTIGQMDIPIIKTWRLNEMHFGDLIGKKKLAIAAKYGEKQLLMWRTGFDVPPPQMEKTHPYYEKIVHNPIYANGPPIEEFPMGETLKMVMERFLVHWNESIAPKLREGKTILIVTHLHPMRAIIKFLDQVGDERIARLSVPNGVPILYELDKNLRPVVSLKFLGKPEIIEKLMERLNNCGYFRRRMSHTHDLVTQSSSLKYIADNNN